MALAALWLAMALPSARAEYVREADLAETPEAADPAEATDARISEDVAEVLEFAASQTGKVDYSLRDEQGEPMGWHYLQQLFNEMTGLRPDKQDLQSSWTPGGKSWCGIWAFWVYREVHDLDLRWDLRKGAPNGSFKIFAQWNFSSRRSFESLVRPGDIFGIAQRSHHGIVEAVHEDGSLTTLEANLTFGRIERVRRRRLSDIVAFYRPLP